MNMATSLDYLAIKAKQNAAWAAGDYARIGVTLQPVGEHLAEALDLAPGAEVLDVAAGNGNATLAMARRGARVTSTDYVDTLLAKGRERAVAEGFEVRFQRADVEALPFEDESFDALVSTFGAMFAPDQAQVVRELLRICRRGGRIGLANWTPQGFIGQLFQTVGHHASPPLSVAAPTLWGESGWVQRKFAGHDIRIQARSFVFRYRTPSEFVDVFRTYYGPVHKAFAALNDAGRKALERAMLDTVARFDTGRDGSMRVPADCAEIVITKA